MFFQKNHQPQDFSAACGGSVARAFAFFHTSIESVRNDSRHLHAFILNLGGYWIFASLFLFYLLHRIGYHAG